MKIAVVGGGASGLVAAIYAKNEANEVVLLERNKSCGKKILMTGNGRCNYWNENFKNSFFHTHEKERLEEIIKEENQMEILDFFSRIGIIPKIKDGYYYPYSNQATSVLDALLCEARRVGVEIQTDFLVESIVKKENVFLLNQTYLFDKVILATGGCAVPKTGSDGSGYILAESFHHTLFKPFPSLVQLISKGDFLSSWAGVRSEAVVRIYEDGIFLKEQFGEVQLTDYGISGICIFNLSRYASMGLEKQKKITVKINFVPFCKEDILTFLEKQNKRVRNRTLQELLEGFLNKKLVQVFLKVSPIPFIKHYEELTLEEQKKLGEVLTSFSMPIVGTKSFESAQVTLGGISLGEVHPETMESTLEKGLYLTGEVLDVDGDCGGYNLGFAWITGMLAGKSIHEISKK